MPLRAWTRPMLELQARFEALSSAAGASEARLLHYAELFDAAPDPTFVASALGVVRHANAAAAAMLGRPVERLRGKPLAVLVHLDDRRPLRDALLTAPTAPTALRVRFRSRRGADHPAELRGVALPEAGEVLWVATLE